MVKSTFLSVVTLSVALQFLSSQWSLVEAGVDPSSTPWSYDLSHSSQDGQMQWGAIPSFEQCSGHMQSPINIDISRVTSFDVQTYDAMFDDRKVPVMPNTHPLKEMLEQTVEKIDGPALDEITSDSPSQWFGRAESGFRALTQQFQLHADVSVETDGHSVVVTPIPEDPYAPSNLMSGAPLPPGAIYKLKSFHIHAPSEHTLNYVQGALEIHLVYELLNSTAIYENAFVDFLREKDFSPAEITTILENDASHFMKNRYNKTMGIDESKSKTKKVVNADGTESIVESEGSYSFTKINKGVTLSDRGIVHAIEVPQEGAEDMTRPKIKTMSFLRSLRSLPPPPVEATPLSVVALIVHQRQKCGNTLVRALRRMIQDASIGADAVQSWVKKGASPNPSAATRDLLENVSTQIPNPNNLTNKIRSKMNLAQHFLYPYKYTDPSDPCLLGSFQDERDDDDTTVYEHDDSSDPNAKETAGIHASSSFSINKNNGSGSNSKNGRGLLFSDVYARKVHYLATEYRLKRIERLENVLKKLQKQLKRLGKSADSVPSISSPTQNEIDCISEEDGTPCRSTEKWAPSTSIENPTYDELVRDIKEVEALIRSYEHDEKDVDADYSAAEAAADARLTAHANAQINAKNAKKAQNQVGADGKVQKKEHIAAPGDEHVNHRHHIGSELYEPMLSDVGLGFTFPRVYAYRGSLTTPPCSQIVTWIVGASPIAAASKDIGFFWSILQGNARKLQSQNTRPVVMLDTSATHKYATSTIYLARARAKALVNTHKALLKPDIASLFSVGPALVEDAVTVRLNPSFSFNRDVDEIRASVRKMMKEKQTKASRAARNTYKSSVPSYVDTRAETGHEGENKSQSTTRSLYSQVNDPEQQVIETIIVQRSDGLLYAAIVVILILVAVIVYLALPKTKNDAIVATNDGLTPRSRAMERSKQQNRDIARGTVETNQASESEADELDRKEGVAYRRA